VTHREREKESVPKRRGHATHCAAHVVLALAPTGVSTARAERGRDRATQAWADAFNSRDPERVLALYDPEAVLWGTVSPTIRDTRRRFEITSSLGRPNHRAGCAG